MKPIAAAICVVLGSTFSFLELNSVWNNCIPPIFKIGNIAIAITMIPIPPSHCNIALQSRIDLAVLSKSWMIVAPVVVSPDIDSKKESTNERFGEPEKKGIAAMIVKIIHDISVNKNADNTSTSWFFFLKVNEIFNPVKKQTIEITKKTTQSEPFK